jgi:hypothetical protein
MNEQSPVDVIINIRKELADFQRTSSTEELRAALKVVCRAALPRWAPGSFHDHQAVAQAAAYLKRYGFRPSGAFSQQAEDQF